MPPTTPWFSRKGGEKFLLYLAASDGIERIFSWKLKT
jgi:hypothetical protein